MRLSLPIAAAAAVISLSGAVSAATLNGQISFVGGYATTDASDLSIGDTVTLGGGVSFGAADDLGDYSAVTPGGTSNFSLELSAPSIANVGTVFSFGPFTFTIDSTETVTASAIGLQAFGLGTVTAEGFDSSESSFRFSVSGFGSEGGYSLFIATPPEEISTVPLPASLPLLLAGLGAFGWMRRRN